MNMHLSATTLSQLVKNPREHRELVAHLTEPCRECERFLAELGAGHQRESLVAMLTARARASAN
jgi:hypothetical protein